MAATGKVLGAAVVVAAASTYLACSLISLDDLRGDGAAPDVATDVPIDAPDAGGDGEAGPSLFQCSEKSGSRVQIATDVHTDFVRLAPFLGGLGRVALTDNVPNDSGLGTTLVMRGYALTNNGNMVTPASLVTSNLAQALAERRYSVNGHLGFVVLYQDSYSTLWATRFPDDQTAWTTPILLTNIGSDSGAINNVQADLDVIDPTTDDYFVVYSSLFGDTQTVYAGEVKGTTTTLPAIASFTNTVARNEYDLKSPAVAYRSQVGYVVLSPNGNSGPPAPGTPAILVPTDGGSVMIAPQSTLNIIPIGFADSVDPALVNIAFLNANLTSLTATFSVGQLAVSSLNAINPQALPVTTPTAADGGKLGLVNLVFSNGSAHWDDLGGNEQFLYAGAAVDPITQTNVGGIDFAWWQATGMVQAYATMFGDIYAWSADAVMESLVGSIAGVDFAWAQLRGADAGGNPNAPPMSDVWIATAGCVKGP